MRVIKTRNKQRELAEKGQLYMIVNCGYVAVTPAECDQMQGVKFYAKTNKA